MSLYLDSGYLNIEMLDNDSAPFTFIVGGRGIGKTYGLLRHYYRKSERIIYVRRTAEQIKIATSKAFCPYKVLARDESFEYMFSKESPKHIYEVESGAPIAYFLPLSTTNNARGFDGTDCSAIVFDEFIPAPTERPIREEAECIFNLYETVNRNRELNGSSPLKMWFLSNANTLYSPVLAELGLIEKMSKMEKKHQEYSADRQRGVQLVMCYDSPISRMKGDTALYRLVDTSYKELALSNSTRTDNQRIKSMPLSEYTPIVRVGELNIYRAKNGGRYYLSQHQAGTVPIYGTGKQDLTRFSKNYSSVIRAYLLGQYEAENILCDYLMEQLIK